MEERSVKGGNCENTLRWVREKLGDDGYAAFLAALPEEAQALCRRRILTVEWVPYRLWQSVSNAILHEVCANDEQRYIQFNSEMAEQALNSTYKFILRFLRASDVLERVCRQFSNFNTHGKAEIEDVVRDGDLRVVKLKITNHAPWHCYALALHGIVLYVLQATGAKDVRIQRSASRIEGDGLSVDFSVSYRV